MPTDLTDLDTSLLLHETRTVICSSDDDIRRAIEATIFLMRSGKWYHIPAPLGNPNILHLVIDIQAHSIEGMADVIYGAAQIADRLLNGKSDLRFQIMQEAEKSIFTFLKKGSVRDGISWYNVSWFRAMRFAWYMENLSKREEKWLGYLYELAILVTIMDDRPGLGLKTGRRKIQVLEPGVVTEVES